MSAPTDRPEQSEPARGPRLRAVSRVLRAAREHLRAAAEVALGAGGTLDALLGEVRVARRYVDTFTRAEWWRNMRADTAWRRPPGTGPQDRGASSRPRPGRVPAGVDRTSPGEALAGSRRYEAAFGRPVGWARDPTAWGAVYRRHGLRVTAALSEDGREIVIRVRREGATAGPSREDVLRAAAAFIPAAEGVVTTLSAATAGDDVRILRSTATAWTRREGG